MVLQTWDTAQDLVGDFVGFFLINARSATKKKQRRVQLPVESSNVMVMAAMEMLPS